MYTPCYSMSVPNKTLSKEGIYMSNELQLFTGEAKQLFCTIKDDGTRAAKAKIFNILQNPDYAISDCIGHEVEIVDVIAHPVELVSEQTGEIENHMRVILIAADGKSYASVSGGVTQALTSIFGIVGQPPYTSEPLKVKFLQKKGKGTNKFLTLELVY